jgi:hypothetical protein
VSIYLTSDVYASSKPIRERALKALSGEASVETVEAAVAMYDLMAEQNTQKTAEAESAEQKETPAQKLDADAAVIAKANALKIDVATVQAAATRQGLDPMAALKAVIENTEQLARDKAAMSGQGA